LNYTSPQAVEKNRLIEFMTTDTHHFHLSYPVPYYAQVASPELATKIFVDGFDPAQDLRWAETGAESPQEYAYWVDRTCGIACIKMCIEALGGRVCSMMDWVRMALEINGYMVKENTLGEPIEFGWVHQSLSELIRREGLYAKPVTASVEEIAGYVSSDIMMIASVSFELGDNLKVTKKGGHLVVVMGADYCGGMVKTLIVNNPSGRRTEFQAGASIPARRFEEGYSGRGIVVGKKTAFLDSSYSLC
jgi:hypothetical protein